MLTKGLERITGSSALLRSTRIGERTLAESQNCLSEPLPPCLYWSMPESHAHSSSLIMITPRSDSPKITHSFSTVESSTYLEVRMGCLVFSAFSGSDFLLAWACL